MKILVLDNGEEGGRLVSWKRHVSNEIVNFQNVLTEDSPTTFDTLFLHYSDFQTVYKADHIYCFLQGLYADKKEQFNSISISRIWRSNMVDLSAGNEHWSDLWYRTGQHCTAALFFSGGADDYFSTTFKEVLNTLNSLGARVGYCHPVEVAQDRLRQVLIQGDVTEESLFGFDARLECSVELLQEFLPFDVSLQVENLTACREQAGLLAEKKVHCEAILEKVYSKERQVKGDVNFEKSKELMSALFDLATNLYSSNDDNTSKIFGFKFEGSEGEAKVRSNDLDESGFHRKYIVLRDVLLNREE